MDVMFWVWLGVIIVTAIIEFATMEVASIWFTFGAIIPFILAATGALNWIWQVVIFVVLSAIMIVALRSVTKKFLLRNSNEKTNVDSLIGQKVRMLTRTDFETVGSVKIKDVVWSAIGVSQQTIEKDEIVTIISVQGNKLVVKKDKVEEKKVSEVKPKKAEKKADIEETQTEVVETENVEQDMTKPKRQTKKTATKTVKKETKTSSKNTVKEKAAKTASKPQNKKASSEKVSEKKTTKSAKDTKKKPQTKSSTKTNDKKSTKSTKSGK